MAVGLLLAGGAALVGALLIAARGTPRRAEAPGQLIEVQEQPLVATAVVPAPPPAPAPAPAPAVVPAVAPVVPAPAPLAPPPAPKRYQILEAYLCDQEMGSSSSTFSLTGVMRRTSWPFVRYKVHVLEPLQLTVVASVEGFVLGQQSGVQDPGFDPMRAMELNVPSTPGTYQLRVLFEGYNYRETRSLSLTIVP